jgi:hypothetical protein
MSKIFLELSAMVMQKQTDGRPRYSNRSDLNKEPNKLPLSSLLEREGAI